MLIYFFNHRSICVTHKFGDIFLRHSQQQAAACKMVTQGMEYKVDTTDRTEPGDIVGLQFTPDDLHIMKKG